MKNEAIKMTNELAINESKVLTMWRDKAQLETIKAMFAKHATQEEFDIFVQLGINTGLNPFLREIWLVKYDKNAAAQIFVGRDGYRKIISTNAQYDGHIVDAVFSNDEFNVDLIAGHVKHIPNFKSRGTLIGAYCIVYMKGSRIPHYVFAEVSEYNTGRSVWKEKPSTMIKKVAEAQAIRMADQTCSSTYSPEEMPDDMIGDHSSKSKKLNQSLSITHGETFDHETGEVTTANVANPANQDVQGDQDTHTNGDVDPVPSASSSAPSYTFDDIKTKMEAATSIDVVNDIASLISSLPITKLQHADLAKIYRKKVEEIKKAES